METKLDKELFDKELFELTKDELLDVVRKQKAVIEIAIQLLEIGSTDVIKVLKTDCRR